MNLLFLLITVFPVIVTENVIGLSIKGERITGHDEHSILSTSI